MSDSSWSGTAGPEAPRLEHMSFGMLLDKSVHLYSKTFGLLITLTIIPNLVSFVFIVIGQFLVIWAPVYRSATLFLGVVVSLFLSAIGSGAVTTAVSERYLGRKTTFRAAYRIAFRRLGPLLGARLLVSILVGLACILLIVPGVILALCYSLIVPIIMLEGTTGPQAMRRSMELTKGGRGLIFGVFALYFILYGILSYAMTFIASAIMLSVSSGPGNYANLMVIVVISQFVQAGVYVFVEPITAIFAILLYYNQRIKKENFDLVVLAEALARQ